MISEALTVLAPPAMGVTVNAAAFPAGFRTLSTLFATLVVTRAEPTICDVPVSRPTTV